MAHEPLIPRDGFYHYGIVVRDLEAALQELGTTLELEWASVQRRRFPLRQPNGVIDVDFRLTYSITGPPHYEVIEATPGTIWDPHHAHGVHHLGYWSHDLAADSARLTAAGYVWEASYDNGPDNPPLGFTYHTLPATQMRIELVDIARKPALDAWFAGDDFPSALEDRAEPPA